MGLAWKFQAWLASPAARDTRAGMGRNSAIGAREKCGFRRAVNLPDKAFSLDGAMAAPDEV